ncbi:MAG TPA: HEAT repeat domain-containing protein, partial [Pricia sp.]|nr:HEAT repeat domain-containing protein [Pricia sp.]
MISEFLFYEDDADKTEKSNYIGLKIEIRDLLREDFNRKILVQILLDLRKDVSGDTQKRLFKLYQDLGLEKDAFKKLESWRWEVVSKGILELTLMQVEEAYPFIVKFINHRRGTIRKQAEIATVTLRPRGISYFLDTTKYRISEWQQLKLLDVVRNKEDFEPPRFKAWLTSTNTQVVLFALRLIKYYNQYYNQNDANASLIELIKHKDRQVKQQAIDCLKEFHVIQALPTLKGVFPKCSVDTKLGILGAIAELGNTTDIEFLETVSQREGNFSVKSKAVGAINTIAPESIMPTENIEHITTYLSPITDDEKVEKNAMDENAADMEKAREGPESYISEEHPVTADSEPKTTDNQIPNKDPLETPTPMAKPKKPEKSLKEIEVEFEEVKAASFENTKPAEVSNFDISEIHFLPIVVAYETDPMDEDLQALINEINEQDFLPVVTYDEALTDTESTDALNAASEFLENIEGYSLSDFEVSFEEKNDAEVGEEDEKVAFDLEDAPIIDVKGRNVEDVMSWLMADNELRKIELNYETVPYSSDAEVSSQLIP